MGRVAIEQALGSRLKDAQWTAIEALRRHNLVVTARTGFGKTIIPVGVALDQRGIVVMVVPLRALVVDLERRFSEGWLKTPHVAIYGDVRGKERERRMDAIKSGVVKIVLVTMETLAESGGNNDLVRAIREGGGCSVLVIDEAHVYDGDHMSSRTAYARAHSVVERLGEPRLCLLSATLTMEAMVGVVESFKTENWHFLLTDPGRPNLTYRSIALPGTPDLVRLMRGKMSGFPASAPGIVYTRSRGASERLKGQVVSQHGLEQVSHYHGGLSRSERHMKAKMWTDNELDWIMATHAFGTGVDKANIRTVVHMDLPPSLIQYAQEAGRAGRDGEPAVCYLNEMDGGSMSRWLIDQQYPHPDLVQAVHGAIWSLVEGASWTALPNSFIAAKVAEKEPALARRSGLVDRYGKYSSKSGNLLSTCARWLNVTGLLDKKSADRRWQMNLAKDWRERVSGMRGGERRVALVEAIMGVSRKAGDGYFFHPNDAESVSDFADWRSALKRLEDRGVVEVRSPDTSALYRLTMTQAMKTFTAEELRDRRNRAFAELEQVVEFSKLPSSERPAAIRAAIQMSEDDVVALFGRSRLLRVAA